MTHSDRKELQEAVGDDVRCRMQVLREEALLLGKLLEDIDQARVADLGSVASKAHRWLSIEPKELDQAHPQLVGWLLEARRAVKDAGNRLRELAAAGAQLEQGRVAGGRAKAAAAAAVSEPVRAAWREATDETLREIYSSQARTIFTRRRLATSVAQWFHDGVCHATNPDGTVEEVDYEACRRRVDRFLRAEYPEVSTRGNRSR